MSNAKSRQDKRIVLTLVNVSQSVGKKNIGKESEAQPRIEKMDPTLARATAFIRHVLSNPALNNLNPLKKEEQILQFLKANAQSLVPTLSSPQFF